MIVIPQVYRVIADLRTDAADDLVDTDIVDIFRRDDLEADFLIILDVSYTLHTIFSFQRSAQRGGNRD